MSLQASSGVLGTFTRWHQDPESCEITITFDNTCFIVLVSPQSFPNTAGTQSTVGEIWERLDDTSFEDDDETSERAMFELIDLAQATCQPIFRQLPLRTEYPPQQQDLDTLLNPKPVMLQMVTLDGKPDVIRRGDVPAPRFEHQTVDTTNINTDIPKFYPQQIEVLQNLWGSTGLESFSGRRSWSL